MDPALKAIEDDIRTACDVDKALPPVFKQRYRCPLGSMVKPELKELQDAIFNNGESFVVTPAVHDIWWKVVSSWIPKLHISTQKIVWWRCSGMRWKRISQELVEKELASTYFHRSTLYRYFIAGLEKIEQIT